MASEEMKMIKAYIDDMSAQEGMSFSGKINPEILRRTIDEASEAQPIEEGVTFTQAVLGGVEVELCSPAEIAGNAILVYMHGGGFVCGNAYCSRGYASQLASEAQMLVYTITYRLAPEYPFPAGLDDCYAMYKALAYKNPEKKIFLLGESAGANLIVGVTLMAMETGIALPAGVIPYSGPFDFTGRIDRTKYSETDHGVGPDIEPAIREIYFYDSDPRNPYISPLYADFAGFPPLFLSWNSGETLSDDSRMLAEIETKAGVEVEMHEYDECFHAFQIVGTAAPESYQVLKDTIRFVKKHL